MFLDNLFFASVIHVVSLYNACVIFLICRSDFATFLYKLGVANLLLHVNDVFKFIHSHDAQASF